MKKSKTREQKLKEIGKNWSTILFSYIKENYDYFDAERLNGVKELLAVGRELSLDYHIIMNTRLKLIQYYEAWENQNG